MPNLLMIESWVGASGLVLPEKIKKMGHRYTFVTRNPEHYRNWATGAGLFSGKENAEHPAIALADKVIVIETNEKETLLPELVRLHRQERFNGVLSCCDYYLDAVAEAAEALDLPGAPPASVEVARQKHLMREACLRAGLPSPAFLATGSLEEARRFADRIGYPLVVKAVDLCAGEEVSCVYSRADLDQAFRSIENHPLNIRGQKRPSEVLIEEYLEGEEFSVETCTYRGVTAVIGITDKSLIGHPYFIESGVMHPAPLKNSDRTLLSKFVCRALTAVGYTHGLTHTEVKLTKNGPRIVEINVRMGGSYLFEVIERVTGVDFCEATVHLALDRLPNSTPQETGIRSAALRFLLPPADGTISAILGVDSVLRDPDIIRVAVNGVVGKKVRRPKDNNDFIGHILAVDRVGPGAREKAESACRQIQIVMS